jgi:hypothetical protein
MAVILENNNVLLTSRFGKKNSTQMLNCEKKAQVWEIAKMYEVEVPEMRHGSMGVKKSVNPREKNKLQPHVAEPQTSL